MPLAAARGSIAMIDPMLDARSRSRSTWKTWKAHVRLLSFCLRYTYAAGDVETLDSLVNEFLNLFTSTYPESYFKPKHHMIEHLPKYLRWRATLEPSLLPIPTPPPAQ